MTSINYTYNDSEGAPSLVEPGEYAVKALRYETGFTSQNNDKIVLQLQIKDGPIAFEHIVFAEKSMWKMDLIVKAFSISKKEPLPKKGESIKIDEEFMQKYITGGYAKAEIKVHTYEDKKSNQVAKFIVPKELPPEKEPEATFELTSESDEGEDVPF